MPTCVVSTPPATIPVDLTRFKLHLRLNTSAEDSLLTLHQATAVEVLTDTTGYVPIQTGFTLSLDCWPGSYSEGWRSDYPVCDLPAFHLPTVYLPRFPVVSVDSVMNEDSAGTQTAVTGWWLDAAGRKLHLPTTRPTTNTRRLLVNFTAGNLTADAVLPSAKTALLLLAAHFYGNREAYTEDGLKSLPAGWDAVCQKLAGAYGIRGQQ